MTEAAAVLNNEFNLAGAIEATRDQGYFFYGSTLNELTRAALEQEVNLLPLKSERFVEKPIRDGRPSEVKQQHERYYTKYGDSRTPAANLVISGLTAMVHSMDEFPELRQWQLREIGYQRYRNDSDYIGPHRDRASDKKLSVTFTIAGVAMVKIFESLGDYRDYSSVKQVDEFRTSPGSIMMLRAPGFGSGKQVIHEVLPPEQSRSILNLRDRTAILTQPRRI